MKELQDPTTVVESLIALRDELENRTHDTVAREILFKINSCLYEHYPIRGNALRGLHDD